MSTKSTQTGEDLTLSPFCTLKWFVSEVKKYILPVKDTKAISWF